MFFLHFHVKSTVCGGKEQNSDTDMGAAAGKSNEELQQMIKILIK